MEFSCYRSQKQFPEKRRPKSAVTFCRWLTCTLQFLQYHPIHFSQCGIEELLDISILPGDGCEHLGLLPIWNNNKPCKLNIANSRIHRTA
jgi:hypothetical protein